MGLFNPTIKDARCKACMLELRLLVLAAVLEVAGLAVDVGIVLLGPGIRRVA